MLARATCFAIVMLKKVFFLLYFDSLALVCFHQDKRKVICLEVDLVVGFFQGVALSYLKGVCLAFCNN